MAEERKMHLFEDYLKSKDEKYYVADSNLDSAKVVIFQPYPTAFDLNAKASVSALKTWHGVELFEDAEKYEDADIGTAYISNVPLYGTDEETYGFGNLFEAVIHSPHIESDFLRASFTEKMTVIINNQNVRLIAYKLEMFDRFYKDFLKTADSDLLTRLGERLESGNLKILAFPNYTQAQIRAFEKRYSDFKSAFDEAIN